METVFILWIFFIHDGSSSESAGQHSIGPFATVQQCQAGAKLVQKSIGDDGIAYTRIDTRHFKMACIPIMKQGTTPTPIVTTKRNEIDRVKLCKDFAEDTSEKLSSVNPGAGWQQKSQQKEALDTACWKLLSEI